MPLGDGIIMEMRRTSIVGLGLAACVGSLANAGTDTWTPTGPDGGFAIVAYLHGKPGSAVAVDSNGILKTVDQGQTWTRAALQGSVSSFGGIAIAPNDSNHVVLDRFSSGLFISDDAGTTFNVGGTLPSCCTASSTAPLAYSPDGVWLYRETSKRLLRSSDGGATWLVPATSLPQSMSLIEFAVSPADHDVLYGAALSSGLLKSSDGGATWSPLPTPAPNVTAIAIDPANANTLIVGGDNTLLLSKNQGTTWNVSAIAGQVELIKFDPVVANRVYAVIAKGKIFRSLDTGANWSMIADLKSTSRPSLSFDSTQAGWMMFGSDDGVAVSTDAGVTWQRRNAGLTGGEFPQLIAHASSRTVFARGTGPTGVFARDANGSWNALGLDSFQAASSGAVVGGVVAFDVAPSDDRIIFASRGSSILKSSDRGTNWVKPTADLDSEIVNSIAIDPINPLIVYVSTKNGVMRSSDGGATWSSRSVGLPGTGACCLAIDSSTSSTMYASGAAGGVMKTTDSGLSWTRLEFNATGSAVKYAIDAQSSNTIYAALRNDGLLRSDDGGMTWTQKFVRSPPPMNLFPYINDVAVDSSGSGIVVAGEYRSTNRGDTWTQLPSFSGTGIIASVIDPQNTTNTVAAFSFKGIMEIELTSSAGGNSTSTPTASSSEGSGGIQLEVLAGLLMLLGFRTYRATRTATLWTLI